MSFKKILGFSLKRKTRKNKRRPQQRKDIHFSSKLKIKENFKETNERGKTHPKISDRDKVERENDGDGDGLIPHQFPNA